MTITREHRRRAVAQRIRTTQLRMRVEAAMLVKCSKCGATYDHRDYVECPICANRKKKKPK